MTVTDVRGVWCAGCQTAFRSFGAFEGHGCVTEGDR